MTTEARPASRITRTVIGVVLMLVALWGGAWGWQFIGPGDEAYAMALLMTQGMGLVAGGFLALLAWEKP